MLDFCFAKIILTFSRKRNFAEVVKTKWRSEKEVGNKFWSCFEEFCLKKNIRKVGVVFEFKTSSEVELALQDKFKPLKRFQMVLKIKNESIFFFIILKFCNQIKLWDSFKYFIIEEKIQNFDLFVYVWHTEITRNLLPTFLSSQTQIFCISV